MAEQAGPGSLGERVQAELASAQLRDTTLVERLAAALDTAAADHGLDGTSLPGHLPADLGGSLALAVLEAIATSVETETQPVDQPVDERVDDERRRELEDLRNRLAQRRDDPDNIENLSFGALARRLVRRRQPAGTGAR